MRTIRYSKHAFCRVKDRLTLPHESVAEMLLMDRCVTFGKLEISGRMFRLFFSRPDHEFFFAIQDESLETIITIMPISYLKEFVVTEDSFIEALRLGKPNSRCVMGLNDKGEHVQFVPKHYYFHVFLCDRKTLKKRDFIMKMPVTEYPDFATESVMLKYMPSLVAKLKTFVKEKITEDEYLINVYVRSGWLGMPRLFRFNFVE